MPLRSEDFARCIVPFQANDTFFLDTNIVVAYLYDEDPYHEACLLFIRYLFFREAKIAVSEVVVCEALNTLARIYYTNDVYDTYVENNGIPPDPIRKKNEIRSTWFPRVVKGDKEKLAFYNEMAAAKMLPFLQLLKLTSTTRTCIQNGLTYSFTTPLASADALIVSAAEHVHAVGLLSIDRDLHDVSELDIFTTSATNAKFLFSVQDWLVRIGHGFENYLVEEMGESAFEEKYLKFVR